MWHETHEEIENLVEREIAAYLPQTADSTEGLLGVPWSEKRLRAQIDLLRECLVRPARVQFVCLDTPDELAAKPRIRREYWLVARTTSDGLVFYDGERQEFGLAEGDPSDSPITIGVRGGLVDTFCAL